LAQNQDATKYRQEVVDTIKFQKDARSAYEKFGPGAKSVEELEQNVTKTLEKKYGEIGTAGSTNSSGQVEIKPDPNPYTREATARHEGVHKATVEAGIAKYGKDTPAFKQWFYNPQNWARDEVKAYSAGIAYLEAGGTGHALMAELVALRAILLNVLFKLANGQTVTAEEMQRLIDRADSDKLRKARERLAQAREPEVHPEEKS